MSEVKQATIVYENGQKFEETLDWSNIEWLEQGDGSKGVSSAQTQTGLIPKEDKETQTSNPIMLRVHLPRTPSKVKHGPFLEPDEMAFFQFDRQAPTRISTSPTLRRMRSSVRRPKTDTQDVMKMNSTQEESVTCEEHSPGSSFSPAHRLKSPLAEPPDSELLLCQESALSIFRVKNRSNRPKTVDNGELRRRQSLTSTEESQAKEPCPKRDSERRRSSVVVSLPGLDASPGDLFVSTGAAGILNHSTISDTKKLKWPFSKRGTTKGKTGSDVEKCLSATDIQDWRDLDFQRFKDLSLEAFLRTEGGDIGSEDEDGSQDHRREEAMWELFTSECVYFLDQLMVLKEVFLNTLTNLQMQDCLVDVDAWRLFANLNELCLVSSGFLSSLLRGIKQSWSMAVTGSAPALHNLLIKAFKDSICHCHQKYCLNYSAAIFYLDSLKQREDFGAYLKWCEGHRGCRRLHLRDLLVAPLHRLTRYPLLLKNMGKRSRDEAEAAAVQSVVELVEQSIRDLEGKVKWLDNYQNVIQLKECLVWPPVWERDKRAFVPENLKHLLKAVTLDNLITHRNLLYEGRLVLIENSKLQDVYLFLFDEFLLITKIKRSKKKSAGSDLNTLRPTVNPELQKEGCTFTVQDQPISLDRLQLKNVDQLNATASGLPNSFMVMHQNRYQQCIAVFILQAQSEAVKKAWMTEMENAVSALLRQDSQQPRVRSTSLWLESSQI